LTAPGSSRNVFYGVKGSEPNRKLVVEWRVGRYSCRDDSAATVKFQIVFFEGKRDFRLNFADVVFGGACSGADRGGSATIGVQMSSSLATQFSYNTQRLTSNMSILWTWTGSPNSAAQALGTTPFPPLSQ
jgi:hypothetical protein